MIPLTDPVSEYQEDYHRHEFYGEDGTHLATIEFDEIDDGGSGKLICEVAIWVRVGSTSDLPLISFERIDMLTKGGNTASMMKRLEATGAGSVNWAQGFSVAVHNSVSNFRMASSDGHWMEKRIREESTPYLLKPFIVNTGVTVLYGKHGDGKSMLALRWGLGVATGKGFGGELPERTGPVLYVDFEDTSEPHELRMAAMQAAMSLKDDELGGLVWHERVTGSLRDARRRLKRLVRDKEFVLVIIDSIGLARAADVSGSEATIKLFKMFNQLGTAVVALDHMTKEDGKKVNHGNMDARDATPIGSQFTQSSARLAWFISEMPQSTPKLKKLNMHNTKHNHTPAHAPIGMTVKLDWDDNHNITVVQHKVDGSAHDQIVAKEMELGKHQQLLLWHFTQQREDNTVIPMTLSDMTKGSGINGSTLRGIVTSKNASWWEQLPGSKQYIISPDGMEMAMLYASWNVGTELGTKAEDEDG